MKGVRTRNREGERLKYEDRKDGTPGGYYWIIDHTILAGDYEGNRFSDFMNLSAGWRIRQYLEAMDVPCSPENDKLRVDPRSLENITFVIHTRQRAKSTKEQYEIGVDPEAKKISPILSIAQARELMSMDDPPIFIPDLPDGEFAESEEATESF